MQKFSNWHIRTAKVFRIFILSLWLMIDENAMDVDGDSLETLLKIFLTLVERLTLLWRS